MKSLFVITLVFLSCFASLAIGASPKNEAIPFDVSVASLPANFPGTNIGSIVDALVSQKPSFTIKKGEALNSFRKSLYELNDKTLVGKISFGSTVAFMDQTPSSVVYGETTGNLTVSREGAEINDKYLAEATVFVQGPAQTDQELSMIALPLTHELGASSSVIFPGPANENFGTIQYYGVELGVRSDNSLLSDGRSVWFLFPLDKEKSEAAIKHGRLLYIGKMMFPFISNDTRKEEIKKGLFNKKDIVVLTFDLQEIWFYNYETGEVYLKQKAVKKWNIKNKPVVK